VEVYRWLAANRRADLVRAVRSLQHSNAVPPLPPALVRELYGNPVRTSVSRLERFASCPFWHFLGTGLGLRPRRVQAVDAPQTGTFFHACLNLFVRRLLEQGREWAELTWGEAAELVAAIVRELSPRLEGEVLLSSAHYRYLARTMERALRRAVVVMRDHARQSQFRPAALELGFGRPGGLPPLELDLGEGWRLELRGQIDRVDVARSSSAVYLRVIDYKPRSRRLDLHEVYHGLALQLLAYLAVAYDNAAVLTGAAAEPAAVFYAGLSEPMLSTAGPLPDEEVERQLRRRFRLQGFCRDDRDVLSLLDAALAPGGSSEVVPVELRQDGTCSRRSSVLDETRFDLLLRFIRHRLRTLGRRLVRGESKPHPYRRHTERACRWCEYAGTCGFDVLLPGNEYRQLRPRPEDELWQQIVAEVELGGASGVT
jgi:ATP-dependent helicase/nuclease subunit B